MKMKATISADIVQSTSLSTIRIIGLRNRILELFGDFENDYPGFWGRIVRGDCIECVVTEYRYVLRIAILLKLFVKIQVSGFDCSEMLKKYGIRFSIGLAELKFENKMEDIIDGPAIYLSGRNLDEISRKGNVFTALEIEQAPRTINNLLDSFIALVSNIVDSYSAKQSEVIFYKLLGFKEIEISERLGIYQSSVNARSSNAQWGLLNTAILDFENIEFKHLCV